MPAGPAKRGKYLIIIDTIEITRNPTIKNSKVKIAGTTTKEIFFRCQ